MIEQRGKLNIPVLISSFLIAFFLWAAVYAQNLPITTRQFEIDLIRDGLDESKLAVREGQVKLKVWATGTEQQISELRDAEKFGLVDLSKATSGTRVYPVALQPTLLRQLANDSVPEVRFAIENLAKRSLPVHADTFGKLPSEDMRLDQLVTEPTDVTISGPQTLADQVVDIRVRFDLSMVDPNRRTPNTLPVDAVDAQGRVITGVKLSPVVVGVTPVLSPSPEEKSANVLVRFKGTPAAGYETAGYKLDHDNVVLVGKSFALAMTSTIETEPIDLTGLTSPHQFVATLKLPNGITGTRPDKVKVRVIVRRAPTAGGTELVPNP